jgi:hypothetical protein
MNKSVSSSILSNIWTILGIIVILFCGAHAFVKGGIAGVDVFTQFFVLAAPFASFLATYYLLRRHAISVFTKSEEWYISLVALTAFIGMLILGLYETRLGENFQKIFAATSQVGGNVVISIGTLAYISGFFRIFRARNWLSTIVMGALVLSLFHASPIGGMLFPPITVFGEFVSKWIVGGGNAAFEVCSFLGISAMIARVLIGKEKLTPETTATTGTGE